MAHNEMEKAMIALKKRIRKASEKNTGTRLNNQEVAWIDDVLNNGWDEETEE